MCVSGKGGVCVKGYLTLVANLNEQRVSWKDVGWGEILTNMSLHR